jgi:uncharacterized protein (TIGR02453 family)
MISKDIFHFFNELKHNNNRDWFQSQKPRYEKNKQNFIFVLELLIHEISQFDSSIKGQQPKDCLFRINRDIRFSKDKSPYKSNMGAFITPQGRNSGFAGYYVHLEPGSSMLAGGIYMPASNVLKAIRQEIYNNFEEFEDIVNDETFVQFFGNEFFGEKLKTRPKGFDENFRGIEYLKLKHFTVSKPLSDAKVISSDFVHEAVETFEAMYPLNRFLNQVVSELGL